MSDLDDIDLQPEDFKSSIPLKKVPYGDVFEAARAGDVDRLKYLIDSGVNVNARDQWDSTALYYSCLAGHLDAARMLLECGAICSEHTFDGDRCHYAALNLKIRKLLKAFEARPPPLGPLQAALRDSFLLCPANQQQFLGESFLPGNSSNGGSISSNFPPDITFYVQGRPIEAHRVILSARSPFFKKKFETEWKNRTETRFSGKKLSYFALYSLIHFFYSDRLEINVNDMEDLIKICKVCKCHTLQKLIEKELIHQQYAEYKALKEIDNSQKRFILQGISLPKEDQLSEALHRILQISLANSSDNVSFKEDDLADVCVRVGNKNLRCHKVVLASRSEYFRARLLHNQDFLEQGVSTNTMPCLVEHDLSMECFEKMIEYMYTDGLKDINPDQAEEMFDAASRYLLFPLKRAVADVLLSYLEMVPPAELCHWLLLSDMYGVTKIREYCLDTIACKFERFAESHEFREMVLTLPPPSGDSTLRTTLPSAPGGETNTQGENILDDLREKWLEAEGDQFDQRDHSALLFDKRLHMLILIAQQEKLNLSRLQNA